MNTIVVNLEKRTITKFKKGYQYTSNDIVIGEGNCIRKTAVPYPYFYITGKKITTDWKWEKGKLKELSLKERQKYRKSSIKPAPRIKVYGLFLQKKKIIRYWTPTIKFPVDNPEKRPKINLKLPLDFSYIVVEYNDINL